MKEKNSGLLCLHREMSSLLSTTYRRQQRQQPYGRLASRYNVSTTNSSKSIIISIDARIFYGPDCVVHARICVFSALLLLSDWNFVAIHFLADENKTTIRIIIFRSFHPSRQIMPVLSDSGIKKNSFNLESMFLSSIGMFVNIRRDKHEWIQ